MQDRLNNMEDQTFQNYTQREKYVPPLPQSKFLKFHNVNYFDYSILNV